MVRGDYCIIKEQKKVKDKFNLISLDDARCYIKKQINRELKHIDVKFLKKVDNRIEEMMIDVSANYIIENNLIHPDTNKIKDWKRKKNNTKETTSQTIESRKNTFAFNCRVSSSNVKKITDKQIDNFIDYWTEKNTSGRLMRFEMQKTFEIKRRLTKWRDNNNEWSVNKKKKYTPIESRFVKVKSRLFYKAWCSKCGKKEMPANKFDLRRGSTCCAVEYTSTPKQ